MYSFAAIRQDLPTCLSCQIRLAIRSRCRTNVQRIVGLRTLNEQAAPPNGRLQTRPRTVKHLNLRNSQVELGVKALGEPAQIRIVRDRAEFKRERRQTSQKVKDKGKDSETSAEALRRAVAAENLEQNPESVTKNIEDVKASHIVAKSSDGTLSADQYAKLVHQLSKGFTQNQLLNYFKSHPKQEQAWDNLETSYSNDRFERSEWHSGVSEFPSVALRRLKDGNARTIKVGVKNKRKVKIKEASSAPTVKQAIVQSILRESWGVRLHQEKIIGELDLRIETTALQVLLQNYEEVFESRSRNFNVKIAVSQPHGIVRLSGDYDLTKDVYSLIRSSLESVKQTDIPIEELEILNSSSVPFKRLDSALPDVEKLTNTYIVRRKNRSIRVFYLGSDHTVVDDVRRLVHQTSGGERKMATLTLVIPPSPEDKPQWTPIVPITLPPLHERFADWGRLSVDMKSSETVDTPNKGNASTARPRNYVTSFQRHLIRHLGGDGDENTAHGISPAAGEDVPMHWHSQAETTVSARLGYVVFAKTDKKKTLSGDSQKEAWHLAINPPSKSKPWDRALIPGFAGQSKVCESICSGTPAIRDGFVITLTESVSQEQQVPASEERRKGKPPGQKQKLKLRLHVDVDNILHKATLNKVVLLCEEREADLLLPSYGADIRFTSDKYVKAAEPFDPALVSFIEESKLDIEGTGQLRTPLRLFLHIPPQWRRDQQDTQPSHISEFHFTSLEYRSQMEWEYEGHQATFTTVEAGRARGKRNELVITMKDVQHTEGLQDVEPPQFKAFREFARSVHDVVKLIPQ